MSVADVIYPIVTCPALRLLGTVAAGYTRQHLIHQTSVRFGPLGEAETLVAMDIHAALHKPYSTSFVVILGSMNNISAELNFFPCCQIG